MGQLTNQFVSQSYQGLFNLENANTGVTSTLQYVTDGIGNRLPMLASTSSIVITGSFRGDGSGLTGVTYTVPAGTVSGSQQIIDLGFATTSSLTSLSQSIAVTDLGQDNRLTALEIFTGSINTGYVSEAEFGTYTSSMNNFTTSIDGRVDALEIETGSLQNQINQKLDTGSFNSYTSSTNNRLNSLEIETGSLQNQINQKLDTGSFNTYSGNTLNLINTKLDSSSFNSYTSSNDSRVSSLESKTGSYATTGSNNFVGQQNINGSVNVTGSLHVTNEITALSASITYLETIYQTSSVIFTSGSNILGDEASDVQTLNGRVDIPLGNLNVTGATTSSLGFFGNLEGTASYASQALSASQAQNAVSASQSANSVLLNGTGSGVFATTGSNTFTGQQTILNDLVINSSNPFGTFVNMISTGTTSFNMDSPTTQFQSNGQMVFTNTLSSTGSSDISFLTQNGGNIKLNTSNSGSIAVSGSFNVTGSASVNGGTLRVLSRNTTIPIDSYLTSSQSGQSNIILGWGDNPGAGPAAVQSNFTGSYRITGSNNIVSLPVLYPTFYGYTSDYTSYISGSNNIMLGNNSTILLRSGSQLFPKTQFNILTNGATIGLSFTTSSLAGGNPTIGSNILNGGAFVDFTHPSGSVNSNGNIITLGAVASTQNFVTNQRPTVNGNNIIGSVTLNHISSSINFNNNYVNANTTVNNLVSSSITTNTVSVNNNMFLGGSGGAANIHNIFASGSQSSNASRFITDNLIGGRANTVSSSFVSSSNSNLFSTIVYGNSLVVSGSHVANTNGGSAFFGRFNDTGSLNRSQDIIFAVGTGFAAANRRTGFWIDSGSNVVTSGSFTSIGNATITGSLTQSGSVNIIGNSIITGSLNVSSSLNHSVVGNNISITGNTFMSASNGFPLYVSGTFTTQRLQFDGNPFNNNPASNLGAIRMQFDNETLQYTNYDKAEITTQSFIEQVVTTGSLRTQTKFGARYAGTTTEIEAINGNGSRTINLRADNTYVSSSLVVSGSLTVASGSGDFYMYGHKMFNCGEFWSNTTQSGSAGVSGSLNFDASGSAVGVSLVSGSRLTITNGGTYNIQFSAQIETSAGADTAYVWFKKNGTNIGDSATKVVLANNTAQVMTVNILDEAAANDYYELGYQFTNGNATILAEAASGNIPAIPSVIATVTQAR